MSNRLTKTFDWRFLVALCFTALVAYAIASSLHTWRQDSAKDARIGVLISNISDQNTATEDARVAATAEREHLLRNQARLLKQWRQLDARQQRILEFLRAQGIVLPPALGADSAAIAGRPAGSAGNGPAEGSPGGSPTNGQGEPGSGTNGGDHPPNHGDHPDGPAPPLPVLPPLPLPQHATLPDVAATSARTRASSR